MKNKAHSRAFMGFVPTAFWKNSQSAEWAEMAMESYKRISKRVKATKPI